MVMSTALTQRVFAGKLHCSYLAFALSAAEQMTGVVISLVPALSVMKTNAKEKGEKNENTEQNS